MLTVEFAYGYKFDSVFIEGNFSAMAVPLLFDVIADLPEGIAVTPLFAADKEEALRPEATRKLSHPADDPSSYPPGVVLLPHAPKRAAD